MTLVRCIWFCRSVFFPDSAVSAARKEDLSVICRTGSNTVSLRNRVQFTAW
jgi:hypothetical protein